MTQQPISESQPTIPVFEHAKRREWGLGVLAWETKDKRGYVFENGRLRIVAEPFFDMMRRVDCPPDEARALVRCLKPELDAARAEQGPAARIPRSFSTAPSIEDQIAIFRGEYPLGFADPRWIEKYRRSTKKSTRTHRDPAIAAAAQKLGKQALNARIAEQGFRSLHEDLIALIQQTELVPSTESSILAATDSEQQRTICLIVAELLHGKGEFAARFGHFLAALQHATNKAPGWQVATAFLALLEPQEHVCVRATTFRVQAKTTSPRLSIPKNPTTSAYASCLAMVKVVSSKLVEHGETPQDLFDVTDFIQFSAQSVARERLAARKHARP